MSRIITDISSQKNAGTGKYVLFDLVDPKSLKCQVVTPNGVRNAIVTDKAELEKFYSLLQIGADKSIVGIYQAGRKEELLGWIPDCVVPQRAKMVTGGHDFHWMLEGEVMAYRLTIPLDGIKNLRLLMNRNDLPTDKILDENFDPAATAR